MLADQSEISFVRTEKRHDEQSVTWPHENGASGLSHIWDEMSRLDAKHVLCGR